MKPLFFTFSLLSFLSVVTLKAQNKAQQDNNTSVSVAKTDKILGRTHMIHYTLTNISSASVDFTLYKEQTDGTWLTARSFSMSPGATYDDEGNAIGMTGRYVVYSAPNSAHADFPSSREVAAAMGGAAPTGTTSYTTAPVNNTPTVSPTPATAPIAPTPSNPSALPVPPPAPPSSSTIPPDPTKRP